MSLNLNFKKFISRAVSAVLVLSALAIPASADTDTFLESFETSYAEGSIIGNSNEEALKAGADGISISGETATVVLDSGSKAIKIISKAETSINIAFSAEVGKNYVLSYDVRREAPEGNNTGYDIECVYTGSWSEIGKKTIANNTESVSVYTKSFTAVAGNNWNARRIKVTLKATPENVVTYIDNIRICEYNSQGSVGMIENGDFEIYRIGERPDNISCNAKTAEVINENGNKVLKFSDGNVLSGDGRYDAVIQFENLSMDKDKEYFISIDIRRDEGFSGTSQMMFSTYCPSYDNAVVENIPCSSEYMTFKKRFKVAETGKGRVKLTFIAMDAEDMYTYVDNIVLAEVDEASTVVSVEYNKTGDRDGLAVCPADTQITMTFDKDLDTSSLSAEAVKLNGESVAEDKVLVTAVDKKTVKIAFNGLEHSKIYTLSFDDGIWKDRFLSPVTVASKKFKTTGRISVGEKKFFADGSELEYNILPATGGEISATIGELTNEWGKDCRVTPILVLYKDDEMVSASQGQTLNVATAGTTDTATANITVPSDLTDGAYELVLYIWSDITDGLMMAESVCLAE